MPRLRPAATAALLVFALFALSPGATFALRSCEASAATASAEPGAGSLIGSALAWGRGALAWLQALIAAEHGHIVPASPPPTTP